MKKFVPGVGSPGEDPRRPVEFGLDEGIGDEAPAETPRVVPPAMRIGDYEVIRELGRGGMGIVYKARQNSLNRIVAIKMILVTKFASDMERLRFFREADLIASLRHPNIVSIHEIGEHEGQPFYSMDFIEGTSLKDLIQTNPLPWEEAARFAQLIAQAMQVAHEHGVIHRDLKPHNILIDHLRNPYVADFGLARDLNANDGLTLTGALIGTPNYMSPEQSSGSGAAQVVPATDVYSIGAILYEMLTTLPPFVSGNLSELLDKVRNKEPLAPKLINPSIPRDLNTVCLKCLQKDPDRRYQTAAELAGELDCVLRDVPIKAKPIGAVERGWRWCKRNRILASVIGGATVIIVLGTTTAFFDLNGKEIHAQQAQRQAEMALTQLKAANQAVVDENKELETVLNEITHEKGDAMTAKANAEQDLVQAIELFHELRLAEAQSAADRVVADQPNLPGGWYLRGQLDLVQEKLPAALKDLQIADHLSPNGLDATGQALLTLVNKYALTAQQTPDGKLTARDALNLLRDLQGRDEYFAFVAAQQRTRDLLLQAISLALAVDNSAKFANADHVSISQEGEEVVLTLKDIPDDPDLSAIRQFPIFTALHLENTGINYLGPFTGMQLLRVDVINSPVASLDALKGMPLRSLTLKGNQVQDLTPLRDAPLNSLILDQTPFPPEKLLQNWPLVYLRISGVPLPVHYVVPKGLQSLGLARTGLADLQFLASSSLTSLDVSGNPKLVNLTPLRGMDSLRQLDLSDTGVGSLLPLANMNLESLSLRNTPVGQVACLKDMPLRELDLRGCKILDLGKLTKLPPQYFPPLSK